MYKHFTLEQRRQIEKFLEEGIGAREIANRLEVNRSSIYRELKRGEVDGAYSAEAGQERYESILAEKGPKIKLVENQKLQAWVKEQLLENHKTPKMIEEELKVMDDPELGRIGYKTINSAIRKGYIPGVTVALLRNNWLAEQKNSNVRLPAWLVEEKDPEDGQES